MREKLESEQIQQIEDRIKQEKIRAFGEGPAPKGYSGRSRIYVLDGQYYALIVDNGFTVAGEHIDHDTARKLV